MNARKHYFGEGFAFPPLPRGRFQTVSDVDAVEQSLLTLMMTEPGERVRRPDYGAGLRRFLFEPNTVATRTAIRKAVTEAIQRFEARANLHAVEVRSDPEHPTRVLIEVRYTLADTLTAQSLVFPLYLEQ